MREDTIEYWENLIEEVNELYFKNKISLKEFNEDIDFYRRKINEIKIIKSLFTPTECIN